MRKIRFLIFNFLKSFAFCLLFLIFSMAAGADSSIRGAFSFSGFSNGVGTRAMGMNGAFAAISDDSSSAYWNPAGLTYSQYKELSFMRANLYNLDLIINNSLNISAPETAENVFGAVSFGWNRLEYDFQDDYDPWLEDAFVLSYAKTVIGNSHKSQASGFSMSCGLALKYLRQTSKLEMITSEDDNSFLASCNAKGAGIDAGVLARINGKDGRNRFSLGIAAQDIPTIVRWNYKEGSSGAEREEYIPYRYKAGCSFEPLPRLTIAADLVGEKNVWLKELHLGIEHWLLPVKHSRPISEKNLAIRGGIAKQLSASERMTFACGLGIRWSAWQLDYAYLIDNNGLGDTRNRFSVSVRF